MEDDLNFDAMIEQIGSDLGYGQDDEVEAPPEADAPAPASAPAAEAPAHPTAPSPTVPDAPKTWRKEASAHWASLPEEIRSEVLKREQDIFSGLEQYKELANYGRGFREALSPFQQTLQQYGVDPVKQVSGLMQAHITLATGTPEQKHALFSRLASDYGVNLQQILAASDPANAPFVDPAVQSLQSNVQSLQSRLDAAERSRQLEARQAYEKQIEAFAADPAHSHFQDVINDMVTLVEKGVATTLQDAYEKAIWANPATRQKELDRQSAEAAKKAAEEATARQAKARRQTAGNVRVSARSGSAAAPLGSIDDTLQETLRAIQSRN